MLLLLISMYWTLAIITLFMMYTSNAFIRQSIRPIAANRSLDTFRNLFGNPEPPKTNSPTNTKKDGGGMFGGMGQMMESMKKAQEIAKQAEVLNKELMETYFTGQDPTGQVTAIFNGLALPISIKVSDSILGQGSEAVSLASTQAMVDGHRKAQESMVAKMQSLYAGTGILPR